MRPESHRGGETRPCPCWKSRISTAIYGKIHALKDVSITVEKGEIVTIIGANGAGKSTMLRTTSGLLKPRSGSIRLEGEDLTRLRPHEIVMKGVVQVPEGRRVFGRLTVIENLEMGAFSCADKQKTTATSNGCSPCSRASKSAANRCPAR